MIVIFYSKNYFKSKNCRREVYAAMEYDKPIVLVYEGDHSVIDQMKEECTRYCDGISDGIGVPDAACILQKLLGDDDGQSSIVSSGDFSRITPPHEPIQWLNEGSFSAAALKKIYYHIICHLP